MSHEDDVLSAKKRIMFIKGEDFNFLAYNILILLDQLDCNSEAKAFRDHRKLAFLVDLVSQPSLTGIIERRFRLNRSLSKRDLHSLSSAYANGESRKHFVERVLYAMATRGIIQIKKPPTEVAANIVLVPENISDSFSSSELFELERLNIRRIRVISPQIRTTVFQTFMTRFFDEQGVRTWHT
jgi:hypothetical protein